MTPKTIPESALQERVRVGATIREFRELRGFRPDELASRVGISRSYLANIEAGRKPLTRVLLAKLAAELNVRQAAIVPAGYFPAERVPA
jgi:transcriptional regulator with XRE-family HTH domain